LRDRERFTSGEPHPLPVTVVLIRDALGKLRAVEAENAEARATAFGAERSLPTPHAENEGSHMRRVYLYRGMKDVAPPADFMTRGGTELAPMSTTSELSVAMAYCASQRSAVLMRLVTDNFFNRGPDISFLSAFPAEAEFLFPPLTYLQPTGRTQKVAVDGTTFDVIDVRPNV